MSTMRLIPRARSATRIPSQCSIRIQILSSCQFWKHIPSWKVWESDQTQGIIVPTHILTYMDSGFLRMKITSHSKLCCYQRRPMLPSILCQVRGQNQDRLGLPMTSWTCAPARQGHYLGIAKERYPLFCAASPSLHPPPAAPTPFHSPLPPSLSLYIYWLFTLEESIPFIMGPWPSKHFLSCKKMSHIQNSGVYRKIMHDCLASFGADCPSWSSIQSRNMCVYLSRSEILQTQKAIWGLMKSFVIALAGRRTTLIQTSLEVISSLTSDREGRSYIISCIILCAI